MYYDIGASVSSLHRESTDSPIEEYEDVSPIHCLKRDYSSLFAILVIAGQWCIVLVCAGVRGVLCDVCRCEGCIV